jgi:hypothetical protein
MLRAKTSMQYLNIFEKKNIAYRCLFWGVVVLGVSLISISHPMMKLRFDIWYHLGNIDEFVLNSNAEVFRPNWSKIWAYIFRIFNIQDIQTYAVIVHRTQFIISCICIYLSAAYLLPALLSKIEKNNDNLDSKKYWISSFALSSMLVWLTVLGTNSTFQQAWIMWYSVNYQLTLPFLFLAIALAINVAAVQQATLVKSLKTTISFVLLLLIFILHAGELIYLFVYILVGVFCFSNKKNINKTLITSLIFLIVAFIAVQFYDDRIPEIVKLIKMGEIEKINDLIQIYGKFNTEGGNRFNANWNAMYALCILCAFPIVYIVFKYDSGIDFKVLLIVLISLVYCFIPTFEFSSGVTSLFYHSRLVNRIYFASLLFILPSLLIYLVLHRTRKFKHPIYLLLIILITIGLTTAYSRYINNGGTYFQNVNSIWNSLTPEKVGIDLPLEQIESIKLQIDVAKIKYGNESIIFCATYDKSHIVRYLYRQKNILFDRFRPHEVSDCISNPSSIGKQIIYIY